MLTIFGAMLWWVLISIVYILYFSQLIGYLNSWSKIPGEYSTSGKSISVIVPFRNEEQNLARLIKGLGKQKEVEYEVLFVNDHSEDQSEEVLLKALKKSEFNYRILNLTDTEGKKAALTFGIEHAQNEIIVTTDADCYMGPMWLKTLTAPFGDENVHMVSGPVGFIQRGLLSKMLSIEFLSLVGIGAASIQKGKPTMANGANLSFRKSTFNELNGFEGLLETPSGDDELLMRKIHDAHLGSVRFVKNENALVVTEPPASWHAAVSQKVRWASKWNKGERPGVKRLALLVGLLQVSQIGLIILMILNPLVLVLGSVLLAVRYLLELLFTYKIGGQTGLTRPSIGVFTLSFIIYPFYALYIAGVANFGSYTWKGRCYK